MNRHQDVHVVPNGKNWSVRVVGNPIPVSTHRNQQNAINAGKPVAQRNESELVIHRPDGRIRDKDSYGHDPNPPTDRKH